MKDFDLESKIKSLPVPKRSEDYWEEFPRQVRAALRRQPAERPAAAALLPDWMWVVQMALGCLIVAFCLWESRMPREISSALRKDERAFRQSMARLHDNLGRVMQDEHGLEKLVTDSP